MYFVGEDDIPVKWTIPVRLTLHLEGEPGEEAVAVGQQQTVNRQVATYCHQPVLFAKMRIREPQFII